MSYQLIGIPVAYAVGLTFLLESLVRPKSGRMSFGVLFLVTCVINVLIALLSPGSLAHITDNALLPFYRDVTTQLIAPFATPFLLLLALYELLVGLLILSKGRLVKVGLIGGMLFCLALIPVGPEITANILLAAAQALLLTRYYDQSLRDLLRSSFHFLRTAAQ